ncbi:hypothetical protein PZB74_03470 [Porifericola rhodea]|uniref:hypothetical protein n=1 Tax=Porifericola rhodea TaxID=930972 RepID=UPI002665C265|nr:hypothetical protein [Porifericola rhodea]WKN32406.1 hypothetical protein PZB74_03470 [Porifericola rhodea]
MDTWMQMKDFPGYNNGFSIEFSINGKGYVGRAQTYKDKGGKDFLYAYDPNYNEWSVVDGIHIYENCTETATYTHGYMLLNKELYEFTPPQE